MQAIIDEELKNMTVLNERLSWPPPSGGQGRRAGSAGGRLVQGIPAGGPWRTDAPSSRIARAPEKSHKKRAPGGNGLPGAPSRRGGRHIPYGYAALFFFGSAGGLPEAGFRLGRPPAASLLGQGRWTWRALRPVLASAPHRYCLRPTYIRSVFLKSWPDISDTWPRK